MSIKLYPVKVQAYDTDTNDVLFTCETFDEVCVSLDVKTVVNADGWPELSESIKQALEMMR